MLFDRSKHEQRGDDEEKAPIDEPPDQTGERSRRTRHSIGEKLSMQRNIDGLIDESKEEKSNQNMIIQRLTKDFLR